MKKKEQNKKLYFEVHLVEHCNLNCKGCAHFSPLAKEEFMQLEHFMQDIRRINYITKGDLLFVKLLGGEPLLHPQINLFISGFREVFPQTPIRLLTNGILLPTMSEDFWRVCRENKVVIEVTKYPVLIDYDEIHRILLDSKVEFIYRGNTDVEEKKFRHLCLDIEGKQDCIASFEQCNWGNGAICLADGKLFTCPVPAYIRHFNDYFNKDISICEEDYVDIYKVSDINEILDNLCRAPQFCRYCDMSEGDFGYNSKYDLSQRLIEEWIK